MNRICNPLLLSVAMLGTAIMPSSARAADDEDAKLTAFFRSYLDELFRRHPMEATRLGDHRFNDRLDDLSPKARAQSLEFQRQTLKKLPKSTRTALGKESAAVRRGDAPTRKELYEKAQKLDIPGRSRMGKAELKRAVARASR